MDENIVGNVVPTVGQSDLCLDERSVATITHPLLYDRGNHPCEAVSLQEWVASILNLVSWVQQRYDYFPHLFGFISAIPSVYEVGGITRKIVYHAFDEALHSNRYFTAVHTLGDLGA